MAHTYTNLPRPEGEKRLAQQLKSINDNQLHLWFGLDYVPGLKDIDIFLWHELAGAFIIEVKAVPLNMIEFFGWENYKIKERNVEHPPHRNANRALGSFQNFLRPCLKDKKLPWFVATACWPQISRYDWNQEWEDSRVTRDFSDRMLFQEDLESGARVLLSRLQHIRKNPPQKEPSKYDYRHDHNQLIEIRDILNVKSHRKAAPSDLEKLVTIENDVSKKTLIEIPPKSGKNILYVGYPGTGKTFRLLQIGLNHATSGLKVLFICFNKTLGADINRIFSYSKILKESTGKIDIFDIFALAKTYANEIKPEGNHDDWGIKVLNAVKCISKDIPKYDTVLVDEAQDMKDWALEIASILASPSATMCVAAGSGQELYGESSEWLRAFEELAERKNLRRNFRNTAPVGRFSNVFYESYDDTFNSSKVEKSLAKYSAKPKKGDEQLLIFERPEGRTPRLIYTDESIHWKMPFYSERLSESYKEIIENRLNTLREDDRPLDLLVLVPAQEGTEYEAARNALKSIGINFIDYTQEEFRRDIAEPEMVRLCTFHSSRGIEGKYTIIFGVERILTLGPESINTNKLGFIIFSRSVMECIICVKPKDKSKVITFLEKVLELMSNLNSPG